jgi:uncharacterized protein (TIGR02147 family)
MAADLPSVYDYDNYRTYLRDYYAIAKSRNSKFSLRYLARIAGFKSFSFLRGVMQGKKNLSGESIAKLTKALKLNKEETRFFTNLVIFSQSTSAEEKQARALALTRSRTYRKIHPLSEAQHLFYSRWYLSALRELPGLPEFKEDPAWIAQKLRRKITTREAKKALEVLQKLGLLERAPDGSLRRSTPLISTPDEVTASFAIRIHQQFLELADHSMRTVDRKKRDISAMTLGMSLQTVRQLKSMIQEFRKEVTRVVAQDSQVETVYQLNLQLFPLIDDEEGRNEREENDKKEEEDAA